MTKKMFGIIAAFVGLTANAVSALNVPFSRYVPDEVERLRRKFMSKSSSNGAVLLLPKFVQPNERFLWLAAHGSHGSHGSHASHASHASGTSHKSGSSCQVYTPLPPALSASAIPGFKDTKLLGQKNLPLILYLPASTATYSALQYKVETKPLNGTVSISTDGTIIYTPNPGFASTDIFSIIATDGFTSTEPVLFTINVKAR